MFIPMCKTRERLCSRLSLRQHQLGYSFIELLISLLIFSVGVLGAVSLQVTSLRLSYDSHLAYKASLLAGALASQLRVTHSSSDLSFWKQEVARTLPSGMVDVQGGGKDYQITLTWRPSEDQLNSNSSIAHTIQRYTLDVAL